MLIGGIEGGGGPQGTYGPIFLIFKHFWGENDQIIGLRKPHLGNPGSAISWFIFYSYLSMPAGWYLELCPPQIESLIDLEVSQDVRLH